ncbi:tol-pal system YbgF family protein [Sorangium sp. So ce118]
MLVTAPGLAEPAPPTPHGKATARALADRGLDHYEAGRYAEALRAFHEAEAAVHAPTLLLMIARTYDKLGRLMESRAVYRRLVNEELAPDSPRAFVAAVDEAKQELAALDPRIPTLEVTLSGAAPDAVVLTVDSERIAPSTPVQRDPGEHQVAAAIAGQRLVTKTIRLREGTREHVVLHLTPPPSAVPLSARAPASPESNAASESGMTTAVVISGGVAAAAGTIAGVVFTLLANDKASEASRQWHVVDGIDNGSVDCRTPDAGNPASQCEKQRSLIDDKDVFSNLALWSFIGGGAAAIGTLGYYWLTTSSSVSDPDKKQMRVLPFVTPGGGGLVAGGVF